MPGNDGAQGQQGIQGVQGPPGAAGSVKCRLAADDARSVTAKNNLTGMAFVLAPNTVYSYEFVLYTTANATTVGVQFSETFDGTVTAWRSQFMGPGMATTLPPTPDATASPHDFNPLASQGNVAGEVRISGTIEVGASGGTLQLQHGSETATLTTVLRGSWGVLYQH